MKPFIKWLTFNELMQRWGTVVPENIVEAVRDGLPAYERTTALKNWAHPAEPSLIVEIPPNEFVVRHQKGELNGYTTLFCLQDVELSRNPGQLTPKNEIADTPDKQDDEWLTGREMICKFFHVGPNSLTSVIRRMRKAGVKEFDKDPVTLQRRLSIATASMILANNLKNNTK